MAPGPSWPGWVPAETSPGSPKAATLPKGEGLPLRGRWHGLGRDGRGSLPKWEGLPPWGRWILHFAPRKGKMQKTEEANSYLFKNHFHPNGFRKGMTQHTTPAPFYTSPGSFGTTLSKGEGLPLRGRWPSDSEVGRGNRE